MPYLRWGFFGQISRFCLVNEAPMVGAGALRGRIVRWRQFERSVPTLEAQYIRIY